MSTPLRVLYFGTPAFAVPALEGLLASPSRFNVVGVVTQPDRPAGRGGKLRQSAVKEVALRAGVPVLQPISIRKTLPEFLAAVAEIAPIDIGVVAAFGQILPSEVLTLPKAGCVNIHGSLLPRWRGAAPIHRAILAGDEKTGVGLMQMEIGLDTGAVYAERAIPISNTSFTGELHDKLSVIGAELLVQHLTEIAAGSLTPRPQPADGVTYAQKITTEEAHLSRFDLPYAELSRRIRAFNPTPGAYCLLGGKRLKIFRSQLCREKLEPGEIQVSPYHSLMIGCADGAVDVLEAQLEGRNRLPVAELVRGLTIAAGERVG